MNFDTINGKKLTQPQKNLVNTLLTKYGMRVNGTEPVITRNWLNGASVVTHPLIAAMVEFVYTCQARYERDYKMEYNYKSVAINTFDRVRYLVLALDSNAYGTLLD